MADTECCHAPQEGERVVTDETYELKQVGHTAVPDCDAVKMQKVVFLGTGSAIPSPGRRNTSAIALILNNASTILLDCGEATQHQLMRCTSVKFATISSILITHLHGDHCFGLFGLLCTVASQGRVDPVVLVGPKGLRQMVTTVLACQGGFGGFPLQFLELETDVSYTDLGLINGGVHLQAYPLQHRVASFGYVLTEGIKPGALEVNEAKRLGATGKQLGLLKDGKDVTLDDGRVVRSVDCVGPPVRARKLALLQDTYDSSAALAACKDVDLLIHECTYSRGMRTKAIAHGHSTSEMVGEFAAACDARMVAMTHFSNRYETRYQTSINVAKRAAEAAAPPAEIKPSKKQPKKNNNVTDGGVEAQLQSLSISSSSPPAAAAADAADSSSSAAVVPVESDVETLDELVTEALTSYVSSHPAGRGPVGGVHAAEDFLAIESLREVFQVAAKSDRKPDFEQ